MIQYEPRRESRRCNERLPPRCRLHKTPSKRGAGRCWRHLSATRWSGTIFPSTHFLRCISRRTFFSHGDTGAELLQAFLAFRPRLCRASAGRARAGCLWRPRGPQGCLDRHDSYHGAGHRNHRVRTALYRDRLRRAVADRLRAHAARLFGRRRSGRRRGVPDRTCAAGQEG